MSRSNRRPRYAGRLRHVATPAVLFAIHLSAGARLDAQDLPPDTTAATVPAPGVPIFLTVGLGYGQRLDRCAYCASAKNTESFTGQANSGRYSVDGNEIIYEAYVAKNPNYMAKPGPERENAGTMTFAIENGVLRLRFTGGNAEGSTATLGRPGQPRN